MTSYSCCRACLLGPLLLAIGWLPAARGQDEPPRPPANARELMATYGIGPAEFSRLVDGAAITPDEEAVIAKVLLRFSRLGLGNIHRWRKQPGDWREIAAATHREQGELFALRGRVTLVTEHTLPAELAQQMEFGRYYQVRLTLDDSSQQAIVLTRTIPIVWKTGQSLDEPAAADGLLLKLGAAGESGQAPLVFAAGRVGWFPDSSPLARAGFDLSLLDAVRDTNGLGLVAADREPFYQLLAALGRMEQSPPATAAPQLDVVGLLQRPAEHHGESFQVRGTARRIVKVLIGEAGLRQRLGLDHYYEIDLFVPLGDARLRFDATDKTKDSPVFENTFPVTLIARQLPPELTEGENLHVEIAADTVFFKLWTYQSTYMARHGRDQPAPLVMTRQPRLVPAAASDAGFWGSAITAVLVGLLLVMLLGWWWYEHENGRRGDGRRRIITTRATGSTP
jgi:hypothetical protein